MYYFYFPYRHPGLLQRTEYSSLGNMDPRTVHVMSLLYVLGFYILKKKSIA